MMPSYNTFRDEIEQIEKYMSSISNYNQILEMDVSKLEDDYKNKILEFRSFNNKFNKKKYDYTVVIINLYGCFEQLIENFIKDYLMMLVNECKVYSQLPSIIRDKHIDLSVSLMGKIEQPKYSAFLTKEQIINNLHECIQNDICCLNYDAFCQHTANFRIQTIEEVLKNIGLADVISNIKRNKELKKIYIEEHGECNYEQLKLGTIFAFLDDLADRRNRIAHGSVSDILSFELQVQMLTQVKLFGQEMDKIGFEKVLPYLLEKSYKIDTIYNPNKKTKLLCFELNEEHISVDDFIIRRFCNQYTYSTIKSIEINHVKYEQYNSQENTDIGIMLDKSRKQNEEYWLYHPIN